MLGNQNRFLVDLKIGLFKRDFRHARGPTEFLHLGVSSSREASWAGRRDVAHAAAYVRESIGHKWGHEGMIAALLQHSATLLVRRYTQLTLFHLQEAIEKVARFERTEQPGESVTQRCSFFLITGEVGIGSATT